MAEEKFIKISITENGINVYRSNIALHEEVGLLRLIAKQTEVGFIMNNKDAKESDLPPIKPYDDVEVGDIAYPSPDAGGYDEDDFIGEVMWKGDHLELAQSKYADLAFEWEDEGEHIDLAEYDLIVVSDTHEGVFPGGPTLFNYNNDPSGVVVYRK